MGTRTRVLMAVACIATVALAVWALLSVDNSKISTAGQDLSTSRPSPSASPTHRISRDVKVAVIGDAFVAGTILGGVGDSNWTQVLAERFAEQDGLDVTFDISSHLGAGYIARGPDQLTFGEAISRDARTDDDIVLVFGSVSDVWQRTQLLGKAVADAVEMVKERSPMAKIVLVGAQVSVGSDPLPSQSLADELSRVADEENATFIDPLAKKWFLGKNVKLLGSDDINPTDAGHRKIAGELYDVLRSTVRRASRSDSLSPGTTANAKTLRSRTGRGALVDMDVSGATARAVRGDCKAGVTPYLEFSNDGVANFVSMSVPVAEILSLSASKSGQIEVVGLADNCGDPMLHTWDPFAFVWVQSSADARWYLSASKEKVHAPGKQIKPGCKQVLTLSVVTDSITRVGCGDGTFFGTMNDGADWTELGRLPGLRAVDFSSPSVGVALSAFEGCAAQTFSTRDGGNSWTKGPCVAGNRAESVEFNGTFWIAQVTGATYSSIDNGRHWQLAGAE